MRENLLALHSEDAHMPVATRIMSRKCGDVILLPAIYSVDALESEFFLVKEPKYAIKVHHKYKASQI